MFFFKGTFLAGGGGLFALGGGARGCGEGEADLLGGGLDRRGGVGVLDLCCGAC